MRTSGGGSRCGCCGVGGQSCNRTETLDSQKFLIPAFAVPFYYSRIFPDFFRILFEWGGKTIRSLFLQSAPRLHFGTACGKSFQ